MCVCKTKRFGISVFKASVCLYVCAHMYVYAMCSHVRAWLSARFHRHKQSAASWSSSPRAPMCTLRSPKHLGSAEITVCMQYRGTDRHPYCTPSLISHVPLLNTCVLVLSSHCKGSTLYRNVMFWTRWVFVSWVKYISVIHFHPP